MTDDAVTVNISLATAREWYTSENEQLVRLATSLFPLDKLNCNDGWEKRFPGNEISGYIIDTDSIVRNYNSSCANEKSKRIFKTEKQATSALTYAKLTQLMALPEFNGDWEPDWYNWQQSKYTVARDGAKISVIKEMRYDPISFKSKAVAEKFIECFNQELKEFFQMT